MLFFKSNDTRRTTEKSDFLHLLEKKVYNKVKFDNPTSGIFTAVAIDSMTVLQ